MKKPNRTAQPPASPSLADPGADELPATRGSAMERDNEAEEIAILDHLRGEDVGGASISLQRRPVGESEFGYVGQMPAETFSKETVRNVYGGGDYRATLRNGKRQIVKNFAFKIDYRIPAIYPGTGGDKPGRDAVDLPKIIDAIRSAIPTPAPAAPPDNTLLLAVMKQNGDLMTAMLGAKAAPQTDPALTQILAQLSADVRDLKGAGNRRGPTLREQIEELRALQEIMGTGGNNGGGDGEEKPQSFGLELVKALGPSIAPLLANMLGAQQAAGMAPQTVAALPADVSAGAAVADTIALPSPAQPIANPPAPDMNPIFRAYVSQFRTLALSAALKSRDPFAWVQAKLDDIPETIHAKVFALANAETWFADIFGNDAKAVQSVEWLQKMRMSVLTFWLVADVQAAHQAAPDITPENYARSFLAKVTPAFHETLWTLCDADGEQWDTVFADVDDVRREALRAAFEKLLGEDDEADTTSTTAETGVAAAVTPAASSPPGLAPVADQTAPRGKKTAAKG